MSLREQIARKFPLRPVEDTGFQPQYLNPTVEGPLIVGKGIILCDKCGSLIRATYLQAHISSGACVRAVQRREEKGSMK